MNNTLSRSLLALIFIVLFSYQKAKCNDKFELLYDSAKSEQSAELGLLALQVADSLGVDALIAKTHFLIGFYNDSDRLYYDALKHYFLALKYYRRANNPERQGYVLLNIGIIYSKAHFFKKAQEFYLDGIHIARSIDNKYLLTKLLYNSGKSYQLANNHRKAIEQLQMAIKNIPSDYSLPLLTDIYTELGYIFVHSESYDSAMLFYDSAILVSIPNDKELEYATLRKHNSHAFMLNQQSKSLEAKRILEEALIISNDDSYNKTVLAEMYLNLAEIHEKHGDIPNSITNLESYVDLIDNSDFNRKYNIACNTLFSYYYQKNSQQAIKYHNLMFAYSHELDLLQGQLEQLSIQYQVEAANYRQELLEREQKRLEQAKLNRLIVICITVCFSILILASVFLFIRYKRRRELADNVEIRRGKQLLNTVQPPVG